MVKLLLVLWLGGIATLVASFYRPDPYEALEPMLTHVGAAEAAAARKDWKACCRAYEEAIATCPADDVDRRMRLQLTLAVARIQDDQLPQMRTELTTLLRDAEATGTSTGLVEDIRFALAKASYDLAWQLRLGGAHPELWREPAATASQHFRLLATEAMRAGAQRTVDYQRYLESAINLTRVDMAALAGLPLPPNCWSNSNCEQKAQRERDRLNKRTKEDKDKEKREDKEGREGMQPQDRAGW